MTAREATDDNIIRRIRIACWITRATATSEQQYHLKPRHTFRGGINVITVRILSLRSHNFD